MEMFSSFSGTVHTRHRLVFTVTKNTITEMLNSKVLARGGQLLIVGRRVVEFSVFRLLLCVPALFRFSTLWLKSIVNTKVMYTKTFFVNTLEVAHTNAA